MCTLALYHRVSERYPLAIAANRDEFLDRATAGPRKLGESPWVFSGLDLVAGGTWLGINQGGMVAGLLNRRTSEPIDPRRRSRGQLCMDALRAPSLEQALAGATQHAAEAHNPFHLLLATESRAVVVGNAFGQVRVHEMPPGVHVITNLEINDPACPRVAKSHALFASAAQALADAAVEAFLAEVTEVLTDHSTPLDPRSSIPTNLCVHLERYGTRCSSVILFDATQRRWRYWYADGPPCRVPLVERDLG